MGTGEEHNFSDLGSVNFLLGQGDRQKIFLGDVQSSPLKKLLKNEAEVVQGNTSLASFAHNMVAITI